jgi:energy-coupling factor transporter ATP-binding protein EcfA2
MNPEVLLFDEPTAALDPRTQQWLIELMGELHRAGKTIVLASHDLELPARGGRPLHRLTEEHQVAATVRRMVLATRRCSSPSTSCGRQPVLDSNNLREVPWPRTTS